MSITDPVVALPDRPFLAAELAPLGLTRHQLRVLEREHHVRRVLRGVYAPTAVPDDLGSRVQAVRLVVPRGHVVIDRTAAWLHGVDAFGYAEHESVPDLEICALRGSRSPNRAGVDGRTRDLAADDVMEVDGVRLTTPLRTALDLGCCLRRREALAAMTELVRAHDLEVADLARGALRFRRRRGVIQLRELIPWIDRRIESARECWVWLALHDAGLPPPEPQVWIAVDGVPTYRLDFAYRRVRVCVEYDGFEAHERTAEQRESDERRRRWLREHGWIVIVVRRGDFSGDALDRWLDQVRRALATPYSTRRW